MAATTYNLNDLAREVAQEFGLSQVQSVRLMRFIISTIRDELDAGRQVRLHQFGTLTARERAAGVARNPATGERITVPARRAVRLTVSPALRNHVNRSVK